MIARRESDSMQTEPTSLVEMLVTQKLDTDEWTASENAHIEALVVADWLEVRARQMHRLADAINPEHPRYQRRKAVAIELDRAAAEIRLEVNGVGYGQPAREVVHRD